MILIWSVVVLLVILGGWVLWEGLKAQTFHSVHMDSLPELRERLGQPHVDDKGRSWTNVATFEIWEAFVMGWEGTTDELIDWLSEGESSKGQIFTVKEFEKLFSVDELRSSELGFLINQNSETRHWKLGESDHDLKIYRDLWDYDQLSERFVEWFEDEYPEGIEACEPE